MFYYNLKDIAMRMLTTLAGLENRMFKRKEQLISAYRDKNISVKKCRFLLVGDSHTYGLNPYMKDTPGIVNVGINGDTTKGLLVRFDENVGNMASDVIIIQIGYNDFKYRSLRETITNYKTLLFKLGNRDKIFICSLFPVNPYRTIVNKKIKAFNSELESICDEYPDYHFVNIFEHLYDANKAGLNPSYTYDGVHLNAEGYKFFLAALDPIINKD